MQKNTASQKVVLLAIDTSTNTPKTGDAANLTAYVSKDDGAVTALTDTSATELDATNAPGLYSFDLTQGETNADKLVFSGKSSTANIKIVPKEYATTPASFATLTIANNCVNAKLGDVAHGGTSATLTFERFIGASTTTNEPCIKLTGNGTAAGLNATGGTNGHGILAAGNGTGNGMHVHALGDATGMVVEGHGAGSGLDVFAGTAGLGMYVVGGGTNVGLYLEGGGTSGEGLYILSNGGDSATIQTPNGSNSLALSGKLALTGAVTASNASNSINLGTGAIDRATFAADTGLQSIRSNTAQAGGATSITLDASASATAQYYTGAYVLITGGTGVGQVRLITDYNGTTKVATVHTGWATNPDATSTFALLPAINFVGLLPTNFASVTVDANNGLIYADATNIAGSAAQASIRTAVGLATNDLDTQLATLAVPGDAMTLTSAYDFAKGTVAMTESYAANGVAPTAVQCLMAIHQMLMQFGIASTNLTVKKLDNTTTAFVVTLDDATNPTSAVRT